MKTTDRFCAWIETQYCASVAATLQARAEFFELLEDAMVSPLRLVTALSAWRRHASRTEVLGGLVGNAWRGPDWAAPPAA